MISPIDSIRQGIETGSWEWVCDGFASLTGQRLAPPLELGCAEEVLTKILDIVQDFYKLPALPAATTALQAAEEPAWQYIPPSSAKSDTNKFHDDKQLAADAIEESKNLSKKFKKKDRRPAFKMINATCTKCNATEEVHPDLAPKNLDRGESTSFICSRCTSKTR